MLSAALVAARACFTETYSISVYDFVVEPEYKKKKKQIV
jgi:hypothetical protein